MAVKQEVDRGSGRCYSTNCPAAACAINVDDDQVILNTTGAYSDVLSG